MVKLIGYQAGLGQFIVLAQTLVEIHSHDEEPNVWCGPVRDTPAAAIEAYRQSNDGWTQPPEGFDSAIAKLKSVDVGVPVKWAENDVLLRCDRVPL